MYQARLAIVSPWQLTVGGMQRMLDLWCRREAHRWDVTILAPGERGPFSFEGATVLSASDAQARSILAGMRPDLMVHHGPTIDYGRYTGCPVVWVVHGMEPLRRPAPRWCGPAAVLSNLDCQEVHPSWRDLHFQWRPLGVDLEAFRPAPATPPADDGRRGLVCGIVGRRSPEKLPVEFVRALAARRPGRWTVRLIGRGADNPYQSLVARAMADAPWVELCDDVSPEAMPDAMQSLDALLVPTMAAWGETGCYAAVEAMATGVAVVARDVPGLRTSCGEAALYGWTDAELLDCLARLDDPELRRAMGQAGRARAEARNDLRAHAQWHSRTFADALAVEVSILMPVYNTPARMLRQCWKSIQAQTFRAWELVLVDDGSTDAETVAEIDRVAQDPRVRLVRLAANCGIAAALNHGMAVCRAPLVARMDADDLMLADRLARQVEHLYQDPQVDILGAQIDIFDDLTGQSLGATAHPEAVTMEVARMADKPWWINHPTVVFRRSRVLSLGGYSAELSHAQDLDLWWRALQAGLTVRNLPDVLVCYRAHPGQHSAMPQAADQRARMERRIAGRELAACP